MSETSDIVLEDDGTLKFVGVAVFENEAKFVTDVHVARPPAGARSGYGYAGKASAFEKPGAFTLAATGLPSAAADLSPKKVGPVFSRLRAMREARDTYAVYDALDALVEAVLELNRRAP